MIYPIVFIASLCGGLVQTVTGFGYGTVLMMILPYFMNLYDCSSINVFVAMCLNISFVISHFKHINFPLVVKPAIFALVASTAAVYLQLGIDVRIMKLIFSAFMVILAIYFMFFSERIRVKDDMKTIIICATLSGLANGLFGIGGPPIAMLFLLITCSKEEYLGTIQAYFLTISSYTVMLKIAKGIITQDLIAFIVPALIGVLLGKSLGLKITDHISHDAMKKVVYVFLLLSGVLTFIQTI